MKELSILAQKHDTDKGVIGVKWGNTYHGYTEIYDGYLQRLRQEKFVLLEIGVGGYDGLTGGGESLHMWAEYFPNAAIHGIDIYPKKLSGRFTTHQGDQSDSAFLTRLVSQIGTPTVIIDDGSHVDSHMMVSFTTLFPLLKSNGGIYIVEDIYRAHPFLDGGTDDKIFDYLLGLAHFSMSLNGGEGTPMAMHFHRGFVIIEK